MRIVLGSVGQVFFTKREKALIATVESSKSAPKIASELPNETGKKVHPQTVKNVLNKPGLKGYYAKKKPFINKKNQTKD